MQPTQDPWHFKGQSTQILSKTHYKMWKYVSLYFNTASVTHDIKKISAMMWYKADQFSVHLGSSSELSGAQVWR